MVPCYGWKSCCRYFERYGSDTDQVPSSLTSYIKNRKGYDYSKHGQSDNPYLDFITEDVIKSFCVLGSNKDSYSKIKSTRRLV